MPDLRPAYAALNPDEQRILRVLSVVGEPVASGTLQQILDALGWRGSDGTPLGRHIAKPLQDRLHAARLIERVPIGLVCHPDLAEPLTRETVADGTFPEIVAAAERVVPTRPRGAWDQPRDDRRLRMIRVALYAGRENELLQLLGLDMETPASRVPYEQTHSLVLLCLSGGDPDWLAGLSPRLKVLLFGPWMRQSATDLIPQPVGYRLMGQLLTPLAPTYPDAADALAEQQLMRGRLDQVPNLLAGRTDSEGLALQGWLCFLQGDYERAIACFEDALQIARKLTRKRKIALPGMPGVLYLLALLRRGQRADFDLVREQIAICLRARGIGPIDNALRVLDDLVSVLAGQRRAEQCYNLQPILGMRGAWPILIAALARHWLGQPPCEYTLAHLAEAARKATEAGLDWYAREAVAALRTCGYRDELPDLGNPPDGLVLMTGLLTSRPAWEIALDALKGLGAEPAAGEVKAAGPLEGPDRRLVWLLGLYEDYASLEPREQKRTKAGGWTQGRAVALKKLAEDPDSFPYLTPQDRAICACMIREQEMSWYTGNARINYSLDYDRALLAAVGHPLVIRQSVGDHPVELVRGGPTLAAMRTKDDILVAIEPFPPQNRVVLPLEETPQRIRLVQFDARHREIARILGPEGLHVPQGAEKRLLEGLAAVAPMLTVHSDVGGDLGTGGAESLPADPRPHFHLSPLEGGLDLELYVHPLGDAGPQLRPGQGGKTLMADLGKRPVRCTRDLDGELSAARALLARCPELAGNDGWSWHLEDPELALTALEQLHALGDSAVLDWPHGKRIALTPEVHIGRLRVAIQQKGNWLDIGGGLSLDDGRVLAMRELLELAAGTKGRFVRLGDNDYLVLSQALRRRLDALHGLADRGRFHPLAVPAIAEAIDGMEIAPGPVWEGLLARLDSMRELDPQVPSTLQAELRGYQVEGYCWLARLAHWGAGACLADDMGLGKTVQALALILARAPQGPTLVLAPMSVCGNWIDEAERFAPTLKPRRFGPGDRVVQLKEAGPFDLIVCSYGLLQSEGERLAEVQWETLVADEAQAFKNALTKRSQAIMRLNGGFRMIATGTPIENRLGELWNLFRFVNPGLLGSEESFNRRFAAPIELNKDQAARTRLRQLLRPFILRRLKSEVLSELPPRTEITLQLELSEGEMAIYEAMRRQAIERLDQAPADGSGPPRMLLLAEIMRLRRACCHPRLALPDSDLPSAKLAAFAEIVDELLDNRHKALVFSQFVDHLTLIRQYLDARGIRYQYLDGSTPEAQRRAAVNAFQAGEGDLFLISLRAGGSGLNLTAADYVIHMDPWWNPAVEDQASDRAHRIGQERPVTVYRLVAKDTIEERILKLHAAKRDLADGLLAGTEDGGRLSYEDMLALVRGAEGGI